MRQLYEYHHAIGYRFIPGLKARVPHEGGGFLVAVNSSGFRCRHEFDKDPVADGRRLLLFGDSFTAGDAVSNKQRYGDLLEDRLPGLQVYNYGLPGSGTDQPGGKPNIARQPAPISSTRAANRRTCSLAVSPFGDEM